MFIGQLDSGSKYVWGGRHVLLLCSASHSRDAEAALVMIFSGVVSLLLNT